MVVVGGIAAGAALGLFTRQTRAERAMLAPLGEAMTGMASRMAGRVGKAIRIEMASVPLTLEAAENKVERVIMAAAG